MKDDNNITTISMEFIKNIYIQHFSIIKSLQFLTF